MYTALRPDNQGTHTPSSLGSTSATRRIGAILAVVAAVSLGASPGSAATLNISGGELIGAFGVDVGGTLYDVEFVDGTCIALFSGCDEASDFTFHDSGSAFAASQALLDQVFLDGVSGLFDSLPELTAGCDDPSVCEAATPFTTGVDVRTARNLATSDTTTATGFASDLDLQLVNWRVYARWTPVAVPEPSTALLVGVGLVALAKRGRRMGVRGR